MTSSDAIAQIEQVIQKVPKGSVCSYSGIAARAGLPGRARLVARVLRETSKVLPWYRILRADGRIAFPSGSEPWQQQIARLEAEGVEVCDGKVAKRYFASDKTDDLDALLWGPD